MGNQSRSNGKRGNSQYSRKPRNNTKSKDFESEYKSFASNGGSKEARENRNCNDIKWWSSHGDKLLLDYGNISFFNSVGANNDPTPWGYVDSGNPYPGIYAIELMPIPGIARNPGDPVNIAINTLMSKIREANSGATNYNASHLMEYFLTMDSALCLYITFVRAYAYLRTYSQTNRYFPEGILYSMNFDVNRANPDSVLNNINDFRGLIDEFATRLSAFPFLRNTYITERHMSMFSYVYADHASTKAQYYLFRLGAYWKLDETVSPAVMNPVFCSTWDMPTIMAAMDDIVDSLRGMSRIATMTGDIKKKFPEAELMTLAQIDPSLTDTPVFSYEMLEQIQNMRSWHHAVDPSTLVITENPSTDSLVFNPTFYTTTFPGVVASVSPLFYMATTSRGAFLNGHTDAPSPEMVVEMTRLMCGTAINLADTTSSDIVGTGYVKFNYNTLGTELVLNQNIVSYNSDQKTFASILIEPWYLLPTTPSTAELTTLLSNLRGLRHFDWHPAYPILWGRTSYGTNGVWSDLLVETCNYTWVANPDIDKINRGALLNVWQIPE